MRTDLFISILLSAISTGLFCWFLRQHLKHTDTQPPFLFLVGLGGVLAYPVAAVSWIMLCVAAGLLSGLSGGDGPGHLRAALDMAVPLDEDEDLIPWGLLPVVLTGCVWQALVLLAVKWRHHRATHQ